MLGMMPPMMPPMAAATDASGDKANAAQI